MAAAASEAVRGADVVITMLPAGPAVRAVFEGEVFPNAASGQVPSLIDCSTIDVATARDLAAVARAKGTRFADAPVSGGVAGAEAGALTFMIGCAEEDLAAIEQALAPMGKSFVRGRRRRRPGGQDLQQHAPRRLHARGLRRRPRSIFAPTRCSANRLKKSTSRIVCWVIGDQIRVNP